MKCAAQAHKSHKSMPIHMARDVHWKWLPATASRRNALAAAGFGLIHNREVQMKPSSIRAWCRPKTALVLTGLSHYPAHTLNVVTRVRAMGAKIFLVQLPSSTCAIGTGNRDLPFLVTSPGLPIEEQSANSRSQAFLWAEILSEATVLKDMPADRVAALAESLGADLVVMTTPDLGLMPLHTGNSVRADLFSSLTAPILIFNVLNRGAWASAEFRRILVPITFGASLGLQIRFACRFARRHHGRITLLHVFDGPEEHLLDRTPIAVEARLPISDLKRESIMCPMEVAVAEGHPGRAILHFEEKKQHDLIMMGCPRPRTPSRGFGPGVVQGVIAEARCPVLVLGRDTRAARESQDPISQRTVA